MNSFGRIFRVTIWGESHGPGVGVVIDGCPPGIPVAQTDFTADLERRRPGRTGTTARAEVDAPRLDSGVFRGATAGSPLTISFANRDVDSSSYEAQRHTPRPGHADYVALERYSGHADFRGGGHFSGRLTVGLVAAGVVAKKVIAPMRVSADVIAVGGSTDTDISVRTALDKSDSVGGLVECRATGLPVGLGEPFFDSVESVIAHLAFAIPGVKGVEFGAGFRVAEMLGSVCNDPIVDADGSTSSNNAGGINGGLTNGNDLVVRVAVKPPSSIGREQQTVDLRTGEPATISVTGRHDACIALRVPVVLEAVVALALADLIALRRTQVTL